MTSALDLQLYYPSQASPTTTIRIRAPNVGDGETIDRRQVIDETAAGNLIVFDRGPVTYHLDFQFDYMSRAERDLLEDFFNNRAQGARNQFELRLPKYDSIIRDVPPGAFLYSGANFESGEIEFTQVRDGWFETAFTVRATTRTVVG